MFNAAYDVKEPHGRKSCVVFASPHSGRVYSPEFLRQTILDSRAVRSSEDAFVDQLFGAAPEFGAPLLCAKAPRAYVDLNRAADELDPALVLGVKTNGHNPRVASGLGVIPRVVANGRAIYRGKISTSEAERRIKTYWHPYHDKLRALLDAARLEHGMSVLIDCHSMPHEALEGVTKRGVACPEVVLGDRFGTTAAAYVMDQVERAFKSAGFRVVRNSPFAGAYVAQAYGRPSLGEHAIQVEIDRSIYMDEHLIEPNANFKNVRNQLAQVIADITRIGTERIPLAAE